MEPSSSPWRAFEATESSLEPAAQATPSTTRTAIGPAVPRGSVLAIGAATVLLVAAAAWLAGTGSAAADVSVDPVEAATTERSTDQLVIDVAGAVAAPGVYRVPAGSRVGDAIAIAGGYGPRVDAQRVAVELNLAALLTDGEHLIVPSRDDVSQGSGIADQPGGNASAGGLIDINRATAAQLDTLPGIGPVTAAKIIASREDSAFKAVDDLRERKLVGQKTLDGLRDLVTVR